MKTDFSLRCEKSECYFHFCCYPPVITKVSSFRFSNWGVRVNEPSLGIFFFFNWETSVNWLHNNQRSGLQRLQNGTDAQWSIIARMSWNISLALIVLTLTGMDFFEDWSSKNYKSQKPREKKWGKKKKGNPNKLKAQNKQKKRRHGKAITLSHVCKKTK